MQDASVVMKLSISIDVKAPAIAPLPG